MLIDKPLSHLITCISECTDKYLKTQSEIVLEKINRKETLPASPHFLYCKKPCSTKTRLISAFASIFYFDANDIKLMLMEIITVKKLPNGLTNVKT